MWQVHFKVKMVHFVCVTSMGTIGAGSPARGLAPSGLCYILFCCLNTTRVHTTQCTHTPAHTTGKTDYHTAFIAAYFLDLINRFTLFWNCVRVSLVVVVAKSRSKQEIEISFFIWLWIIKEKKKQLFLTVQNGKANLCKNILYLHPPPSRVSRNQIWPELRLRVVHAIQWKYANRKLFLVKISEISLSFCKKLQWEHSDCVTGDKTAEHVRWFQSRRATGDIGWDALITRASRNCYSSSAALAS